MKQFVFFGLRDSFGRVPADIPDDHIHQCIGLIDQGGRDIYEGDIVEFSDADWSARPVTGRGEIVRCGDMLLVESPCWGLHFPNGFHSSLRGAMTIVGNIFEGVKGEQRDKHP